MQANPIPELHFEYLPTFARHILQHRLVDFISVQATISKSLDLPMLKYYEHLPAATLQEYAVKVSTSFLQLLSQNKASHQLKDALVDWESNQLEYIRKEQIHIDDLLSISHMRKRAFLTLLPDFTTEVQLILRLVEELEWLFLAYDRSTTQIYVQLLKNRIAEDIYFREKLAGTSPGFYYIYDIIKDNQVQSSYKLFDYLGYTPAEYRDDQGFFTKIIHPGDRLSAAPYLNKVKKGADGEVHFFEYRLLTKNREYKWMRNYESIYKRDENGEANQLIGLAFDISREHDINEKLKSREEDLLEAQELANMGSFTLDIRTGCFHNTPQTNKILGFTNESLMDALLDKVHPADKKTVTAAIETALAGQGDFEIEYRCVINGKEKIIWGKGKVSFDNGQPVLLKGTVMDVTDKHHMIQKLTRSESLYKQAEALNKLGNWIWEIKTDRLEWSDELYRIYGLAPGSEKLSFERFVSFIHPEDRDDRIKKLENQMQHHELQEYYFRIIAADGKEKILFGQSRVLADEAGIPFKFVGTCQDVTAQKELENKLYQKTIQLERSNASLQDFAFISSHDLKEPLRKISVFGDRLRLLQKENLSPDSSYAINKMVDAAKRMQRMVDELLALSRITHDQRFTCQPLQQILEEVLQRLEDKIIESRAVIDSEPLPEALVNEVQFGQLFENLISNALKFSRPGVPPKISITYSYPAKSTITRWQPAPSKKYLAIAFADNGIGFEKAFSEKIFTIFQRLHRGEYEGTGIGLALCKKIVEHHNGFIYADATEQAGAIFTVVLPVC